MAERQRAARSVRFFDAAHGCIGMTAVLPPLEGAELRSWISAQCDREWKSKYPDRAQTLGGHNAESREQRLADALVSLIRGQGNAGGRPTVIVTLEAETLRTAIVGQGPLPLEVLPEVLARSDVYAAIRDGTNRARLRFGRNRRVATELQRLALIAIKGTCWVEGCSHPGQGCDVHHETAYEDGGLTDLDNLALFCERHHRHHHTHASIRPDESGKYVPSQDRSDSG
jgi:hypothetical protein